MADDNIRTQAEQIFSRAKERRVEGESSAITDAIDTLAALADGSVRLDELPDDVVQACLDSGGDEGIICALLERLEDLEAEEAGEERTAATTVPPVVVPFESATRRVPSAAGRRSPRWRSRGMVGLAIAAGLAAVVGTGVLISVLRSGTGPAGQVAQHAEDDGFEPAALAADAGQDVASGARDIPAPPAERPLGWPQNGVSIAGLQPREPLMPAPPQQVPDFSMPALRGATMGGPSGSAADRRLNWRLATPVIRVPGGWGSGAFISPDGWLLTSYHVVAAVLHEAALTGGAPEVDVIRPQLVDDELQPMAPVRARVFRVDPALDLALLRLVVDADSAAIPFFALASDVAVGIPSFFVGSRAGAAAWQLGGGDVEDVAAFPDDVERLAPGTSSDGNVWSRVRARLVKTDAPTSAGDAGGPLLNADGELIGLTFAAPPRLAAQRSGWHIALDHLRSFTANLPAEPDHIPFDLVSAGMAETSAVEPTHVDGDGDGRPDTLVHVFGRRSQAGDAIATGAMVLYIDFEQRASGTGPASRLPSGVWGVDGAFAFSLAVAIRSDGLVATAYRNAAGIVDDIRVGQLLDGAATHAWRRGTDARWTRVAAPQSLPMSDRSILGDRDRERTRAIIGRVIERGANFTGDR